MLNYNSYAGYFMKDEQNSKEVMVYFQIFFFQQIMQ